MRFEDPKFVGEFTLLEDLADGLPARHGKYVDGKPVITRTEPLSMPLPTTAACRYEYTPLSRIVRDLAYKVGDFTLASGAKSAEYVNVKNALLHPHALKRIAAAVEKLIVETPPFRYAKCVAGPELGAIPLVAAVALAAGGHGYDLPALMVRKKGKEYGTRAAVDGLDNVSPGDEVVLVEDVLTTGASSAAALEALRAAGLNPVGVVAVVDREQGATALIAGTFGVPVCRLMTLDQVRAITHECTEYRPTAVAASEFTCPVCLKAHRLVKGGPAYWEEFAGGSVP